MLQPGDRRVGEQLEIVVRQATALVDDGGALGLDADADTAAGEPRRGKAEEGRVGRVAEAHDARP